MSFTSWQDDYIPSGAVPVEQYLVSSVVSLVFALLLLLLMLVLLLAALSLADNRRSLLRIQLLHYAVILVIFVLTMEPFVLELLHNTLPTSQLEWLVCVWKALVKYPGIISLAISYTGRAWRYYIAFNAGSAYRFLLWAKRCCYCQGWRSGNKRGKDDQTVSTRSSNRTVYTSLYRSGFTSVRPLLVLHSRWAARALAFVFFSTWIVVQVTLIFSRQSPCTHAASYMFTCMAFAMIVFNIVIAVLDTMLSLSKFSPRSFLRHMPYPYRDRLYGLRCQRLTLFHMEHYAMIIVSVICASTKAAIYYDPSARYLFHTRMPVLSNMQTFFSLFSFLSCSVGFVIVLPSMKWMRKRDPLETNNSVAWKIHVARLKHRHMAIDVPIEVLAPFLLHGERGLFIKFTTFASREQSLENVLLYLDIVRYKNTFLKWEPETNFNSRECQKRLNEFDQYRRRDVEHILQTYISPVNPHSEMEVNLGNAIKTRVLGQIHEALGNSYTKATATSTNYLSCPSSGSRFCTGQFSEDLFDVVLPDVLDNLQDIAFRFCMTNWFRLHVSDIVLSESLLRSAC